MRTLVVCMSAALVAGTLGCVAQEQEGGSVDPPDLVGNWTGTFDAGDGAQLRLQLVVSEEDGVRSVPIFSVDRWNWERRMGRRFSFRLGAPVVTVSGDTISVPLTDIEASYTGTWPGGDGKITGTFT